EPAPQGAQVRPVSQQFPHPLKGALPVMNKQSPTEPSRTSRWRGLPVAVVLLLLIAACSSDNKTIAANSSPVAGQYDCAKAASEFLTAYDQPPSALPSSFTPLSKKPQPGGSVIKIVSGAI